MATINKKEYIKSLLGNDYEEQYAEMLYELLEVKEQRVSLEEEKRGGTIVVDSDLSKRLDISFEIGDLFDIVKFLNPFTGAREGVFIMKLIYNKITTKETYNEKDVDFLLTMYKLTFGDKEKRFSKGDFLKMYKEVNQTVLTEEEWKRYSGKMINYGWLRHEQKGDWLFYLGKTIKYKDTYS